MYIIGSTKVDKYGRVLLSGLIDHKETPKVIAVIDTAYSDLKFGIAIALFPSDEDDDFGLPITVDDKNRVVLPRWIRDELGSKTQKVYLAVDKDSRGMMKFLLIQTPIKE